jgi:hypothetical protein
VSEASGFMAAQLRPLELNSKNGRHYPFVGEPCVFYDEPPVRRNCAFLPAQWFALALLRLCKVSRPPEGSWVESL